MRGSKAASARKVAANALMFTDIPATRPGWSNDSLTGILIKRRNSYLVKKKLTQIIKQSRNSNPVELSSYREDHEEYYSRTSISATALSGRKPVRERIGVLSCAL
jgi:hypothetical protein